MKLPALLKSRFFLYSISGIAISGAALAGAITWLGLDNNVLYNSADHVLETVQAHEEIGFSNVANLIASFIQKQEQLRAHESNTESQKNETGEEQRIFGDLPSQNYATRDVHRKTNGCFEANLQISPKLFNDFNSTLRRNQLGVTYATGALGNPGEPLKTLDDLGVFQPGAHYDAIVRFSNGHPLNRPDSLPDARGFAVKILPQETLNKSAAISAYNAEELNQKTMLDILSINFPTFFVNQNDTAKKYLNINQYFLHGAYDFRNNFAKTKLTEGLATFAVGLSTMELRLALMVNGSVIDSNLFQEYFSMVPSRLGTPGAARAVKYIWVPAACSSEQNAAFEGEKKSHWQDWTKSHDYADPIASLTAFNPTGTPNHSARFPKDYLREHVTDALKENDACFALYLQPYLNQDNTNIEDSTDIWLRSEAERAWWLNEVVPSSLSPYWELGSQNREQYVENIKHKAISVPVFAGLLKIKKLSSDSPEAGNSKSCEDLSFNPWNGDIDHHKPLGVISRLKRRVYNASRRMRHALNGIKDIERRDPK